jgi:uncharacterized protein YcfJ
MRKILMALSTVTMTVPTMLITAPVAEAHGGYWRGNDGRLYCRRSNGTVGLVVGAAGGALIGRAVDGGRSRATGTILGAAAGALIGREIQRKRTCR